MANRLSDDMLRFIIDLDATGAQGEINTLTAGISKMEKENKSLAAANRETAKEIQALERQLAALEKQGKQNTSQYQNLTSQLNASRQNMEEFNKTIQNNNRQIKTNQQQQQELLKSLKLEDMTMNQLRERARQLSTQLNNTSRSANPQQFQKLSKELNETQKRMANLTGKNKSLLEQMSQMPGSLGTIGKGISGIATKIKLLSATNPILLAIAIAVEALKAAFSVLKTAIAGSDSASTKLQATFAALGSIMDSLKRITTQLAGAIWDLWTRDWKGLKEHLKNTKDIASNLKNAALSAYDAAVQEDALNDTINRNNDLIKVNQARVEELRQISQDTTKDTKERIRAFDELLARQTDSYNKQVENITGQYDVWKGKNSELIAAFRRSNQVAFQEVEQLMQKIKSGAELTIQEQEMLTNAANDIARDTDNATEEQKTQFRKFFNDLQDINRQYYSNTRRDRKQFAALTAKDNAAVETEHVQSLKEIQEINEQYFKEDLQNAKEYYKEQLLELKEQYVKREITEKELQERALQEQLNYLNRVKQMQEEAGASTLDIDTQIADLRLQINQNVDKAIEEQRKKAQANLKKQAQDTIDTLDTLRQTADTISRTMGDSLGGELMQNLSTATEGIKKMMNTINSDTASMGQKVSSSVQGVAAAVSAAMNSVAQITKAAFELETNALEAEKQKQLSIAGDNAERRAQIEREYAEKELELKKKQADADAAVQTSKLWINTAMGIATAWATSMELGPIAGPIIASVLTAGLLATAGVEQANIVAQRDAIKNTTLDNASSSASGISSSSASGTSTHNTYTLKQQYSNPNNRTVSGYATGGYTGDGDTLEPAGVVHRGEYVIPKAELRNPVVVPMVRKIEAIRTNRLRRTGGAYPVFPDGYADGGPVTAAGTGYMQSLEQAVSRLNQLLEQGIHAEVNYYEFQQAQTTIDRIKQTARR